MNRDIKYRFCWLVVLLLPGWQAITGEYYTGTGTSIGMGTGTGQLYAQQVEMAGLGDTVSSGGTLRDTLSGQRVMQTFDFEERQYHYLNLPMYWRKIVGRAHFPHYSSGRLDTTWHHSGKYSFELISDGGSVGFSYNPRRIRIKPGSDFHISGYVHLENAPRSRARIVCALTDRIGRVIKSSVHKSSLVSMLDEAPDGWARVDIYIPGNFPKARYVTLELLLLQEEVWNTAAKARGAFSIFQRDVHAKAWFDDISILQIPRVNLYTGQTGNVFGPDSAVELKVEVEGFTALDYQIHLTVRDAQDKILWDEAWVLSGVEGELKTRTIKLPDLRAGLYRATLAILSGNKQIATRTLVFVRLAGLQTQSRLSGNGFGLLAMDSKGGSWDSILQLAHMADAQLLKIPVWSNQTKLTDNNFANTAPADTSVTSNGSGTGIAGGNGTGNSSNVIGNSNGAGNNVTDGNNGGSVLQKGFDKKLIELQQYNIDSVAVFAQGAEADGFNSTGNPGAIIDILSQNKRLWYPQVASLASQYAQQITYWQVGADDLRGNQPWDPRIKNVVQNIHQGFDSLVSGTVIVVPLDSILSVNRNQVGTDCVDLFIPASVPPEVIPAYLQDWRNRGFKNIWVTLKELNSKFYPRQQVLNDFARRIVYARKGFAQGVFINHPWFRREYKARSTIEPTELFAIFRTMADYLGPTRYVGKFYLASGVPAFIFDHDGKGCLFVWDENGTDDNIDSIDNTTDNSNNYTAGRAVGLTGRNIKLYLGQKVVKVDLFGNRSLLKTRNGLTSVNVTHQPILISNVNTNIALLRSYLKLVPSVIDASVSRQHMYLEFKNPFNVNITGRLRFVLNDNAHRNWVVNPSSFSFILRPYQSFRRAFDLKFPANELGGKKQLGAYITLEADSSYKIMAQIPFEISLKGVDVSTFTHRVNQNDLLVQQVVTNETNSPLSLRSFLDLPDMDRMEQSITKLSPGSTVTRNFLIKNANKWVGRYFRIGLYDPNGTRRINYQYKID